MQRITAPLVLAVGLALGTLMSGGIASARADASDVVPGYEVKSLMYNFAQLEGHTSSFIRVDCPEGKKVLGGGAELRDSENRVLRGVRLVESGPLGEGGWVASILPTGDAFPAAGTFTVRAICATVAP